MERDEETGLGYHNARYYAPWLGRWTACDPISLGAGDNLYRYSRNNPVGFVDPRGTDETSTSDKAAAVSMGARVLSGLSQLDDYAGFTAMGKGLRSSAIKMTIDEINAVSNGGSWSDPSNKTFLDSLTNSVTKNNFISSHTIPAKEQISLADELAKGAKEFKAAASQIVVRRFSEIKELEAITNDARAAMRSLNRSDRKLANAINKSIRGRIASGATAEAKLVANALKEVGFDAKTLTAIKPPVAAAAAGAESTVAVAKGTAFTAAVAKAAPILTAVAKPLAVVGKVAGPLGVAAAGVQLATAENTSQKVDASISLVSSGLMMSKHPVAVAAGAGLMAGQLIENTLNVSDHASSNGLMVYEAMQRAGINEDASFVAGAAVSVVSTPLAIQQAAVAKVASWFR